MTNQLTTLHAISAEYEAAGLEPFWPEGVVRHTCTMTGEIQYGYAWTEEFAKPVKLLHQHALDLVQCAAERWLRAEGWEPYGWDKYTNPSLESREQAILLGPLTLTEALRYELERQKTNTKGTNQ